MKLLLYCTKAKPELYITDKGFVLTDFKLGEHFNNKVLLNGKIVAECDFEVEEIHFLFNEGEELIKNKGWRNYRYVIDSLKYDEFYKKSCLSFSDLDEYFDVPSENGKVGYAIHIKNLHIFDEPRELDDCEKYPKPIFDFTNNYYDDNYYELSHITKAPQNMCKVKLDNKPYILISIKPEWLCKILNGEKTIEVRKKVLKEMLGND